jgi:hypothetical protein
MPVLFKKIKKVLEKTALTKICFVKAIFVIALGGKKKQAAVFFLAADFSNLRSLFMKRKRLQVFPNKKHALFLFFPGKEKARSGKKRERIFC